MDSNWITLRSANPSVVLPSVAPGNYEVEVTAIDAFGNRSVATNSQQAINRGSSGASDGQGTSIEAVEGAAATALSPTIALLTWTPPRTTGLSVAIRHTPSFTGGTWDTGNPVTLESPLASDGQVQVPALSGCYLLRFVNDSGTGSFLIAAAPFNQSPTLPFAYAVNYLESASNFAGAKSNCYYDASIGALRVSRDGSGNIAVDTRRIDDLTGNWDSLTGNIDNYGVDGRIAVYSFANQLDLGAPRDVELVRTIKSYSLGAPVFWDSIVGDIDDATFDLEGKFSDGGEVFIEYSTSQEAPSATAKWSEWAPLTHCYALMRSLRLRARLVISDVNQDLAVTELGAAVLLPQQIKASATLTTSAATLTVTFDSAFHLAPSVNITAFDLQTGDYFQIASLTASGFTITFRNAAGTAVARNFQYQAVGFGSGFALVAPPPSSPTDPLFSSVLLLCGFNGSNGSTSIVDEGPLGLTLTASGSAQISTAQSVFGDSSLSMTGTGAVALPTNSSLVLTDDFTFEARCRFNAAGKHMILGGRSSGANMQFARESGTALSMYNGASRTASFTTNTNTWYALCWARSGSTVYFFADGTLLGTATLTGSFDFSAGSIGNLFGYDVLNGFVDELRLTSVCRYTAGYTVDTSAFPRA